MNGNYYVYEDGIDFVEVVVEAPTKIEYTKGIRSYMVYTIGNMWHNEDGPAFIERYKDGTVRREIYCINGKWHREDGPASIKYDIFGEVVSQSYFINGKKS